MSRINDVFVVDISGINAPVSAHPDLTVTAHLQFTESLSPKPAGKTGIAHSQCDTGTGRDVGTRVEEKRLARQFDFLEIAGNGLGRTKLPGGPPSGQ